MKAWLLLLLLANPAAAAPRTEIAIGFNPAENSELIEANGKRLSDFLKKKTGLEVKTFVATDYTALVEALRSGRIDFAFLPPFSFVKAETIADARVLLKAVRHGKAVYYSAIIARSDRGYKNIDDLKGKNIAWVDPSSATGFIIPKATLMERKHIDPDAFFGKQIFAGSHDALVLSVFNKTVDAGATWVNDTEGKDGAWQLYLKTPAEQALIKMLLVSNPIPGDTLTTTNKLNREHKDIVDAVTKTLSEMAEDPEGKKILSDLYRIDKMIPASPKDFDFVRAAAKLVGVMN